MQVENPRDEDPLKFYLREVANIQPLGSSQTTELFRQIWTRDQHAELAMKTLIEATLSLAVEIAERFASSGALLLDLIEAGNVGLIRAVESFQPDSAVSFSAHAAASIEPAIPKCMLDSQSAAE
jgi:DNA-directed RNA polymerase sigma subunit (sigma70/sigma32)